MGTAPAPGEAIQLRAEEAEAARQLMGLAVGLGPVGVVCLKHLLESLLLFASGRALLAVTERIGLDAGIQRHVHQVSHWYELSLFVFFSVFCAVQLVVSRVREFRESEH